MTSHAAHESFWVATAPFPPRPELDGAVDADVAIVGGGIVGVTAAYLLAEEGRSVVLLEADRIVEGVTGNTTAKVTAQHGLVYKKLADRFGEETARLHGEAGQAAIALIERLIHETGAASAKWTRAPSHVWTEDEKRVKELQEEAQISARVGLPASFTTETELPLRVKGAVRFEDQAHFHPRHYLRALAERAERRGARIFEWSPVVEIEDGETCQVRTRAASVRAKHVLVATNAPITDRSWFATRISPKRDYALALAARPGGVAARLEGMYVNVDEPHRSIRPFASDEGPMAVVAGEKHKVGEKDPPDHYARLEAWAREHFDVGELRYSWSTHDHFPLDDLALIGKIAPRAKRTYTATGFRAWGMTQGTVAAMIFVDAVLGRANPWRDVYDPFRPGRIAKDVLSKEFAKETASAAKDLVGERLHPRAPQPLAPGQGQVARVGGRLVAMSKDEHGVVRTLSATCTHMGCLLEYNPLEASFDCRCHGSRFGLDGRVLHGPAVEPLKPLPTPHEAPASDQ